MKFPIHRVDQQNALETVIFMVGRCVSTTPIETERTGEKRPLRKISRNVLCLILGFRVSTSAAQNAWHQLKGRKVTIMAEYIKREDAIKSFLDADTDIMADYGPDYGIECGFSRDRVKEILGSLLAADVAEVRHGRWIEYPRAHYFKCSGCKYTVPYRKAIFVNGNREYNYCPHCGALMKEDEHEAG